MWIRNRRFLLVLTLAAITLLEITDSILDGHTRRSFLHALADFGPAVLAAGAMAWVWQGLIRAHRDLGDLQNALAAQTAERNEWRQRAQQLLNGLGEQIDAQFEQWSLSPAERETALMVLKGFSHREIAALLEKSERTVRQQASAVYQKSGLRSRSELAAFFLEDLLLPSQARSD